MKKTMLAISVGMLTLASLPRFAPVEILAAPTPNQNGYPSANGKTGIAAAKRAAKKRRRAK
ncbi:hypothetical protein QNN86_02880 [Citrobacter sp. C348]|uniref:hypothetical protein n=1 Tax=Citrobacter sp. C348 TaxID=3048143 RepID=UPI0039C119D5